jgi:hypothetical protein
MFFKTGTSNLYVYGSKDKIEDYGELPDTDNKNLIELIGKFIFNEEFNAGYVPRKMTYSIVSELAKRMGLIDDLLPYDEIFDEDGHFKRDD